MDVIKKHLKKYTVKLYILELETENYHIFARGKWKGHPVNIIIDTGASHTCFDIDFFKSIDSDAFTTANTGINVGIGTTEFETSIALMQNFKIGRFQIHDFQTVLLNLKHINQAYIMAHVPTIQCILGSDFFVSYNAIIDFSEQKLTLFA
jgi:hypothetical protein